MNESSPAIHSASSGDVLLYGGLLAACIALVWLLPFFPSNDGPSHVYNLVILRDLLHGQGDWGRVYVADMRLRPNLGFQLVAYPLLSLLRLNPLTVHRAFLTVYILLVGAAVPVYLRAFGRAALPVSFFVFVVIFNRPLIMGFYSYVVGISLLLFALALAWTSRQRTVAVRVVAMNVAGLILYVVHLFPLAIFLLALALMAVSEVKTWKERVRGLVTLGVAMSPCLLLVFAGFIVPRAHANVVMASQMEHRQLVQQVWLHIIDGIEPLDLASFSGLWFSRWNALPGLVALVLFVGAAVEAVRRIRRAPGRLDEAVSSSRFLVLLCAGLFAFYFVTPDFMLGTGSYKMRLPWVILLLALPLIEPGAPRVSGWAWGKLLMMLAVVTLSFNAAFLWRGSETVERFVRGLQALPRDAMIMSVNFDVRRPRRPDPLRAATSYYGLHGCIDYSNYEPQMPYLFPVHFRQPPLKGDGRLFQYLRQQPKLNQLLDEQPQSVDWSRLPEVQFLLCWKAGADDRLSLSQWYAPFWEESDSPLTIWKRK